MTLEEAHALAAEIEAGDRCAVVAIGRFEMVRDLIANPAKYPWGVSLVSRVDPEYKAVLRTRDDVREFVLLSPAPAKKPAAKPQLSPPITSPKPAPQSLFAFE